METLRNRALQDLTAHELTDCSFEFKDEGKEKEILMAHKLILASVSPVFEAMLYGPLKETSAIHIKDISFKSFRQLIWHIYGQPVDLQEADEACELYNASKKYEIPTALEIARTFMLKTANISNVSSYYYIAGLFDDVELVQVCDDIFTSAVYEVTKKPNFFVATESVSDQNGLEVEDVKSDSQLNAFITEYKNSIEQETCKETRICKTLGLIRYLATEVDKLFATIMPNTLAKLYRSFNFVSANSILPVSNDHFAPVPKRPNAPPPICSTCNQRKENCGYCHACIYYNQRNRSTKRLPNHRRSLNQ